MSPIAGAVWRANHGGRQMSLSVFLSNAGNRRWRFFGGRRNDSNLIHRENEIELHFAYDGDCSVAESDSVFGDDYQCRRFLAFGGERGRRVRLGGRRSHE